MRKKDKEQNQVLCTRKDLQHLEKKFEEQKMILVKENKKLQTQIYRQIEQNNLNKVIADKYKEHSEAKIQELQLQVENLKARLLIAEQKEDQQEQEEHLSILKNNKELIVENSEIKAKLQEYMDLLIQMGEQNERIKEQNSKYSKKNNINENEIANLREQIDKIKEQYIVLQDQSELIAQELQDKNSQVEEYLETVDKLEGKLTNAKKKKKQTQLSLQKLELRLKNFQAVEINKLENEIVLLKQEKEDMEQEKMTLNRKIDFLQVNVNQKNDYIKAIDNQLQTLKQTNIEKQRQYCDKREEIENENRRLIIDIQNLKTKLARQGQEHEKNIQDQKGIVKKKTAEQIFSLLKGGDFQVNQRTLQSYIEGLRSCKSQSHMRSHIPHIKLQEEKKQASFQKFKYENQISHLQNEVISLKKHNDMLNEQKHKISGIIQGQKQQIDEKDKRIKELLLMIDRNQHQKNLDIQVLRNQNRGLKNKETECLELTRVQAQMEQAMNLKIAFYEKKFKEKLDAVERKDNVIENLKEQRTQLENKTKFLEDKLAKSLEDLDNLKKLKADCSRKDDLMRDYKDRYERYKVENESLKFQYDKIKKEKSRLDKNLQSKEEYISSIKSKLAKEIQDQENKQKEDKNMKQLKEKYEQKLKKLKKDYDHHNQLLFSLKDFIYQKIEESMKKSSSGYSSRKWQAAELLGLENVQIQQFVNPAKSLDRQIYSNLENLWEKGYFVEFIRQSLEYLIIKNGSE